MALFYFSGHGSVEQTGGYLITSDAEGPDDGLSMENLMTYANESPAKHKIIILDCCHAGQIANGPQGSRVAELADGVTILTASTPYEVALEADGEGVFTSLLVETLEGAASDLLGNVLLSTVYALIDQSLGFWSQRPLFKGNLSEVVSLRKVNPPIELQKLHRIKEFFPTKEYEHPLDPSYEFTHADAIEGNTEKFSVLQKLTSLHLVTPVGEDHMYFAAINSKSCRLTHLGKHYWRLVDKGLI